MFKTKIMQLHLVMLLLFFSGCEDQSKSKVHLDKNALESLLNENQDFISFVNQKNSHLNENFQAVEALSVEERNRLKYIVTHYENQEALLSNGSHKEIEVFNMVVSGKSYRAGNLIGVQKLLQNYAFNQVDLVQLIKDKLSKNNGVKNEQMMTNCNEVWTNIYVQELNNNYYVRQMDLVASDLWATMAADWAYVGCVQGQMQ